MSATTDMPRNKHVVISPSTHSDVRQLVAKLGITIGQFADEALRCAAKAKRAEIKSSALLHSNTRSASRRSKS